MFSKLTKKQKIIVYFIIFLSFAFIITIPMWIMFFIGSAMEKKDLLDKMKVMVNEKEQIDSIQDNAVQEIEL